MKTLGNGFTRNYVQNYNKQKKNENKESKKLRVSV